MNHFASYCRIKSVAAVVQSESSEEEFLLETVVRKCDSAHITDTNKQWFEAVKISGSKIKMKVDSGAEKCTIPWKTWKKVNNRPQLVKTDVKLKGLGGDIRNHIGKTVTKMSVGDKTIEAEIIIATQKTTPIIGLQAAEKLGLIQRGKNSQAVEMNSVDLQGKTTLDMLKTEYNDVFTGLG